MIRFIVPEPWSPFALRIILIWITWATLNPVSCVMSVLCYVDNPGRSGFETGSNPIQFHPILDSWHLHWLYIETLIQSKMRCPKIPLFFTTTFAITPFLWNYSLVFMHWCLVITRRKTVFGISKQHSSFETPFIEPTFVPKAS